MPRGSRADDAELIAAAARGDDRSFEVFYRRHVAAVLGFHLRRTGRRELAFDLTAETFAAVVASLQRFDPALGSPASWLFGIAANRLATSARRGRVEGEARARLGHEPILLDDDALERVEELASMSTEEEVAALLAEMPAAQRDAVLAHVVDEEPYRDIAQRLKCSEAVVRQRVHRGLLRLRQRLEESA